MILDQTIAVSHLTKDTTDADKEQYQLDAGLINVAMNIQVSTPEEVAITEGQYARTFTGFTTQSGIRVGDKVTVSGTGQALRVRAVSDWSNPDLIPHYEYTLVEFEEEELV